MVTGGTVVPLPIPNQNLHKRFEMAYGFPAGSPYAFFFGTKPFPAKNHDLGDTGSMELHHLSQQPSIRKGDVIAFFDRLAPGWEKDLVVDTAKINTILDVAGVGTGRRVLDVACGTGVLFPFYRQRQVAEVLAVDISPEMAKIAAGNAVSPIRVLCHDIETLSPTGDYDCCVVYNAFPHFPDPAGLIEHLARWLVPGGRLTVAHSMGIAQLNRHHAGSAAQVSMAMLPAADLAELFSRWFAVDAAISDGEKYLVSGTKKG